MTHRAEVMPQTENKTTVFDVALYLISSARDCLDEPHIYGPLRLLEGVNRVIKLGESLNLKDEFLERMKSKISDTVILVMQDREKFNESLENLLLEFVDELKKRHR